MATNGMMMKVSVPLSFSRMFSQKSLDVSINVDIYLLVFYRWTRCVCTHIL